MEIILLGHKEGVFIKQGSPGHQCHTLDREPCSVNDCRFRTKLSELASSDVVSRLPLPGKGGDCAGVPGEGVDFVVVGAAFEAA